MRKSCVQFPYYENMNWSNEVGVKIVAMKNIELWFCSYLFSSFLILTKPSINIQLQISFNLVISLCSLSNNFFALI